jgi:nucleoside-diphosphate-sugar epimerase
VSHISNPCLYFREASYETVFHVNTLSEKHNLLPVQYIIGDGNNYYDFTYVENVAYGHVCAEKTLSSEDGAKIAAGKVKISLNI